MNTDKSADKSADKNIEQARAELDHAREAHAAAMIAKHNAPADPSAQQQLKDAVQQGKGAWKGYQTAATAGLAAQIEEIVPTDFR